MILGIAFLGLSYLNAMTFDFGPLSQSSVIEVELKTNGNFAKHGIRGNFSNIGGQIHFFPSTPTFERWRRYCSMPAPFVLAITERTWMPKRKTG